MIYKSLPLLASLGCTSAYCIADKDKIFTVVKEIEKPVDKIVTVYRDVPEVITEKIVYVDKPVFYDRAIEVPVDRVVYKEKVVNQKEIIDRFMTHANYKEVCSKFDESFGKKKNFYMSITVEGKTSWCRRDASGNYNEWTANA